MGARFHNGFLQIQKRQLRNPAWLSRKRRTNRAIMLTAKDLGNRHHHAVAAWVTYGVTVPHNHRHLKLPVFETVPFEDQLRPQIYVQCNLRPRLQSPSLGDRFRVSEQGHTSQHRPHNHNHSHNQGMGWRKSVLAVQRSRD